MTSFPDPDQSGSYAFRAPNAKGRLSFFGTLNDALSTTIIRMAGNGGLQIQKSDGSQCALIEPDGRNTLVNVPQLQLAIPPNPPNPYVVDADPSKSIIAGVMVAPVTINMPTTLGGTGYFFYILAVDPFGSPVGAPLPFPLTVVPNGADPINLVNAPKVFTTNFQLMMLIGPGSGGWGAFAPPLFP